MTKQTHKTASDIAEYYKNRGAPEIPEYFDDDYIVDESIDNYGDRIELMDDVVYMVEQGDWTKHGVSQKDREVEALRFIKDNSVLRFPDDHIIKNK